MSRQSGHYALAMAKVRWDASRNYISVSEADEDSLEALAIRLHDLVHERMLSGVTDLRIDDGTLLTIDLKRGADTQAVLDEISKSLPTE